MSDPGAKLAKPKSLTPLRIESVSTVGGSGPSDSGTPQQPLPNRVLQRTSEEEPGTSSPGGSGSGRSRGGKSTASASKAKKSHKSTTSKSAVAPAPSSTPPPANGTHSRTPTTNVSPPSEDVPLAVRGNYSAASNTATPQGSAASYFTGPSSPSIKEDGAYSYDPQKPSSTAVTIHPDRTAAAEGGHRGSIDDTGTATDAPTLVTITGGLSHVDYAVSFYPRMTTSHLEQYYLFEAIIHLLCGCCQKKRSRQLLLLSANKFVTYLSPILGSLWCMSMVLSLWFFTDALSTKYLWVLYFAGIYPLIRLGFSSLPIMRLLLSSFETWFLLVQVGLMIASFGYLVEFNLKFYFALICLMPGLTQMILLDSNNVSLFYSCFALLFGSAYMFIVAVLLTTGKIVLDDKSLVFQHYEISLIDFTTTRLFTLVLFMLKNIVAVLRNRKSYIQIRSRVYKEAPPPDLLHRVSIV